MWGVGCSGGDGLRDKFGWDMHISVYRLCDGFEIICCYSMVSDIYHIHIIYINACVLIFVENVNC